MKKECDSCKKEFKNLRMYKGQFICYKCYKKFSQNIITQPTQKFLQPLNKQHIVTIILTKNQDKFLKKRVKEFKRLSNYVRELIINDMENM